MRNTKKSFKFVFLLVPDLLEVRPYTSPHLCSFTFFNYVPILDLTFHCLVYKNETQMYLILKLNDCRTINNYQMTPKTKRKFGVAFLYVWHTLQMYALHLPMICRRASISPFRYTQNERHRGKMQHIFDFWSENIINLFQRFFLFYCLIKIMIHRQSTFNDHNNHILCFTAFKKEARGEGSHH